MLYNFGSTANDGERPSEAKLIQATDGNFYGTTDQGGTSNGGTVFRVTPAGVETVLYSFPVGSSVNGYCTCFGVVQGSNGDFYGTTQEGGGSGSYGTVFNVTAAGVETELYAFGSQANDGERPYAGLIEGSDGNFYGTTSFGGTTNGGTVWKVTPAGVETVLYSFGSAPDGFTPYAGLTQGSNGNFYGTNDAGGAANGGTIFQITPAGVETILYSFPSNGTLYPQGLITGSDGNLYGTTLGGGAMNLGTVFKITPAGVETLIYSFSGPDGAGPNSIIQGSDGNFYGTTTAGGAAGNGGGGTVFKLTPAGVETVLYSFGSASSDPNEPFGIVQGSDGNFYGTTIKGGVNNQGTVWKVTP